MDTWDTFELALKTFACHLILLESKMFELLFFSQGILNQGECWQSSWNWPWSRLLSEKHRQSLAWWKTVMKLSARQLSLTWMAIVDDLWALHCTVIVLEDEAGIFALNSCILSQIYGALSLSGCTHAAPIFAVCEKKGKPNVLIKKQ